MMAATWQPLERQQQNAEKVLIPAYRALLAGRGVTDAYLDRTVPPTRRLKMVIITRDGGAFDGLRDAARMRFRFWAPTEDAVNDLASLVIGLTPSLVTSGVAFKTEHLSGPLDVADTTGPQRYALIEIHLPGKELP